MITPAKVYWIAIQRAPRGAWTAETSAVNFIVENFVVIAPSTTLKNSTRPNIIYQLVVLETDIATGICATTESHLLPQAVDICAIENKALDDRVIWIGRSESKVDGSRGFNSDYISRTRPKREWRVPRSAAWKGHVRTINRFRVCPGRDLDYLVCASALCVTDAPQRGVYRRLGCT